MQEQWPTESDGNVLEYVYGQLINYKILYSSDLFLTPSNFYCITTKLSFIFFFNTISKVKYNATCSATLII